MKNTRANVLIGIEEDMPVRIRDKNKPKKKNHSKKLLKKNPASSAISNISFRNVLFTIRTSDLFQEKVLSL